MRSRPKRLISFLVACASAVFIVFLGLATHAQQREVLRVPLSSDIGTFDPDNGFEIAAISAVNDVYEGLVKYESGSTKVTGSLAKAWDISEDGMTYTFHLVGGVRFHDGAPMNADAVVKSLKRRRDRGLVLSYFLKNVKEISAQNEDTVVLRLHSPQPSLLDSLASPWGPKVISPQALDKHDVGDSSTKWLNEHAAGTGPYTLVEFKRAERYSLERSKDYWGKRPFFDRIELPVIPDLAQQILKLQAGEIDVVPKNYPIAQLDRLPPNLEITAKPSMTQFSLFIKPGTALENPEVRRAVLTAINPNLWVREAFGKYASVSQSPYQNMMLTPEQPIVFPTDLEAAKRTIAKHAPVNLTFGLYSAAPSYGRISDLMMAQLALIGVNANAHILPPGAAYAMKGKPDAPDLLLTISSPDAADPENQATAFFTKDAPGNFYGRQIREADALVNRASVLADPKARNSLYEQSGHMYFDAGFVIPLIDAYDIVVHIKGLRDLGLRPVFPPGNIDFASVRK
ncbi:ABC transporter substrate-binding protein [Ensifer sp. ENS07]|uniref:ABC transporter substrate-binding protein n=1 Tax=unclassified Ensifer TaxID=2633371 RepID=UPI00178440D9|nr:MULTISPECIES: ABC transporter substrate-binding protein [unclassified Ensifer]MBD9508056.1 ABC transporter substrate-binding protein [Ensifer sp. ENS10]MBD9637448.1 ABC transporter substrate-binding protein [Ensifer sp. ENS07]